MGDLGFCTYNVTAIDFYSNRMSLQKVVFEQMVFEFLKEPERELPPIEVIAPVPADQKCRNHMCSKRVAEGKAYCSKAHSPYGLLADEPDNAPIDGWTPPEGFYQWNTHRLKAYSRS